jgi:hypothetical protein
MAESAFCGDELASPLREKEKHQYSYRMQASSTGRGADLPIIQLDSLSRIDLTV